MNPLPNRSLVNNGALPLSLPNLPNFEGNALNGRPRKLVPDINNKEFPLVNGVQQQGSDRGDKHLSTLGSVLSGDSSINQILTSGLKDGQEDEPTQLTAIFRPDDTWRERLRLANEEAAMRGLSGGTSGLTSQTLSNSGWDLGQDDGMVSRDVDDEDEDSDSALQGEDGAKKWRVRRTLRK